MARKKQSSLQGGRKECTIKIRLSQRNRRMIERAAEEKGVTMSRFIVEAARRETGRAAVEEAEENSPTVRELKRIRAEIRRIGLNVNQIAHWANHDMHVYRDDEVNVVAAVARCERLVDEIRGIVGREV